jgi:hypothetical protein
MTSPRTRTAARLVVIPAAVILGAASLGCGIIQNVMDTANTLSEFGDRLGKAAELTYTAEYAVAGGENVTLVQEPPNAAFIAGDGRMIFTADSLVMCDAKECQRAPVAGGVGVGAADAGLVAGIAGPGFVTPELALGLVAAAALVPGTDVATSERKFAGQDALCADVTGVADGVANLEQADDSDAAEDAAEAAEAAAETLNDFSVCVTEDGVLAAFTGKTQAGEQSAIELIKFRDSANRAAFAPPKGAKVVDVTQLPGS